MLNQIKNLNANVNLNLLEDCKGLSFKNLNDVCYTTDVVVIDGLINVVVNGVNYIVVSQYCNELGVLLYKDGQFYMLFVLYGLGDIVAISPKFNNIILNNINSNVWSELTNFTEEAIKDGILPTIVPASELGSNVNKNVLCAIWSSWSHISLNVNIEDGTLYAVA